jgi:ABC-2 type transport system ATP-binding protein
MIGKTMTTVNQSILVAEGLSISFASGFTLGPIDVSLPISSTIAVLGRNGAGKSTFFQLMTGNLDATAGTVTIQGEPLHLQAFEAKRKIGYLPQDPAMPRWATGREILHYAAALYELENPRARVSEMMAFWDCAAYADRPVDTCSYGMLKRIGLALAVIHDPPVLVLDEPFSGLDIFHIKALEDVIRRRAAEKRLTILSTHVIPYVAELCQQVFIVDKGKVQEFPDWLTNDRQTKESRLNRALLAP